MSRGPGRIERAIRALFDASPDLAFVTDELAEHCYPDLLQPTDVSYLDDGQCLGVQQKHRVAVLRAARRVLANDPNWSLRASESHGGTMVFYNRASAHSLALASTIGDFWTAYRSPARIRRTDRVWQRGGWSRSIVLKTRQAAIERGGPDEVARQQKHADWHVAYRDADPETRARMDAEAAAAQQAWIAAARAMGFARQPQPKRLDTEHVSGSSTLTDLAAKARALMVENDPDAIRAGLAEIADALDPPAALDAA